MQTIHVINITTKTREGDAYDEVAINCLPIVYIGDGDVKDILKDEDLHAIFVKYIRNHTTYNNAMIRVRSIYDDDVKETSHKLSSYVEESDCNYSL